MELRRFDRECLVVLSQHTLLYRLMPRSRNSAHSTNGFITQFRGLKINHAVYTFSLCRLKMIKKNSRVDQR